MLTDLHICLLKEGEVTTVEVTRRLSEERDILHNSGNTVTGEEKDRRLQRWKDKLAPRDEDTVATNAAGNASRLRRDRLSRIDNDAQVNWLASLKPNRSLLLSGSLKKMSLNLNFIGNLNSLIRLMSSMII